MIILPVLTVAQGNGKNFRADGTPAFVTGRFGAVNGVSDAALRASAKSALQGIVVDHFGAAGNTALVVVGLAGLPSTWIWGRVSSRIGGHKALAIAYTFMAIGIVLPVFDASVPSALISAALFGATFLGIVAMTVAVGAEMMPHARTFAIDILSTAFALGQLVGPILAGEATILFGNFTAALYGDCPLLAVPGSTVNIT